MMIHNMAPQTWPPRPLGLAGSSLGQWGGGGYGGDYGGGGGGDTGGSQTTSCHKCPGIPPMMLLPQPSISTCVPVDESECAPGGGETPPPDPVVEVCPTGTDELVCAVMEAQAAFQAVYEQQLNAWNYYTTGRPPQIASFALDQAHAAVRFTHPRLLARWETYSWWIGDQGIPAEDWPALLDRVDQTTAIFNAIPFPVINDYYTRCVRGIPLANGFSIANPRFYTDTFNAAYWPKEDWQIETDMAGVYTVNMKPVFLCIEHKFKKTIREMERSKRAWELISFASIFVLGPMAGGAGVSLIATSGATTAYSILRDEPISGEMETLVAGIVSAGVMSPEAIAQLLQAGITALISDRLEDWNPMVRDAAISGAAQLTSAAISDYTAGLFVDGVQPLSAFQTGISSVAAVGIRILANMIKAEGLQSVEGIQDTLFALQNVDERMVPYMTWVLQTLLMGSLFEAAAELAAQELAAEGGTTPDGETPLEDFDMDRDIIDPMIDDAEAAGVHVPGQGLSTLEVAGIAAGGVGAIAAVLALTGTI